MQGEQHYLVGLDLAGRRVVVVGGGTVAQRRLPRLVAAGAVVDLISPEVTPAVEGMVDSGEVTWHARGYADGDLDDAWYVLACTSVTEVNARIAADAEERRGVCVRADVATPRPAGAPPRGGPHGVLVGGVAGR